MEVIDPLLRSCCDYPRDYSLDQLDRIYSLPHSPANCGVLCPIKLDRIHSAPPKFPNKLRRSQSCPSTLPNYSSPTPISPSSKPLGIKFTIKFTMHS